jgi:TolB-like protein/DNA-binding winged helix-turn-helix (wHTH) protein
VIYTFNYITIDTDNFQLLKNGEVLSVEPQVFNVILYLVENKDKVVPRNELLDTIWKGRVVSDSSISNHIKSARKILDDDGVKQAVIKTIHGRGYQFVAELEDQKLAKKNAITHKQSHIVYQSLLAVAAIIFIGFLWFQNQTPSTNENSHTNNKKASIAVLAFKDLSPLSDHEYFSEGISEELLNIFTKIPNLRVASRTSSFSFKNKSVTIEDIGKDLNVDYVMEGSVRKADNKLRITAQLIRIADGSHIWSETYDHTMDDIFKIQDSIATEVTKQLKIKLGNDNIKVTPVDPQAYTLYLQAIYLLKENTEPSIRKSLKLIGESIAIDPNYARSWTVYSRILYAVAVYSYKNGNDAAFMLAKQAVIKALELDPNYATAYAQMVYINLTEGDMKAAKINIDKAMKLNSKSSTIVGVAAYYHEVSGQLAQEVEMLENAIKLDPLYNIHYLKLGIVYLMLNRYNDAYTIIEKYEFFNPQSVAVHAMKSHALLGMGKNEEALIEAEKETNDYWKLSTLGFATYANGDFVRADKILNELITDYGDNLPGHIASLYAFRNDADNAFKWLEKSYNKHLSGLVHTINFQTLRNLWSDPRWDKFINKIGLEKGHWLLEKRLEG